MSDPPKSEKKRPKGINPTTGKPYEPVERKEFDALLRRAAKPSN